MLLLLSCSSTDGLTIDIEYYILTGMKPARKVIHPLLERMSRIERMERGTLCRLTGRPHYNHQTWQDGRNVVRYVPTTHIAALQEAVTGYRLFMELAQQYAEEIIQRTRRDRPLPSPRQKPSNTQVTTARRQMRNIGRDV